MSEKCCNRVGVQSTHWEGCHKVHPSCAAYKAGMEAGMRKAAEICLKQADKTLHTEAWNDGCEECNYAILAAIGEGK